MTINERLFSLMAEKGISQLQVGTAAGVSFKTVSAWKLRGNDPPAACIAAIAELLGVSVQHLLTGSDDASYVSLSDDAMEVATMYDALDRDAQRMVMGDVTRLYVHRDDIKPDTRKFAGQRSGA